MTPLDLAANMAASDDPAIRAQGVAIVVRGLTDDDPRDATRQGWPLCDETVSRAARWLGLDPTPDLIAAATAIAPTLSDAILNRGPR